MLHRTLKPSPALALHEWAIPSAGPAADRKTGAISTDTGKGIAIVGRGADRRWRMAIDGGSPDRLAD